MCLFTQCYGLGSVFNLDWKLLQNRSHFWEVLCISLGPNSMYRILMAVAVKTPYLPQRGMGKYPDFQWVGPEAGKRAMAQKATVPHEPINQRQCFSWSRRKVNIGYLENTEKKSKPLANLPSRDNLHFVCMLFLSLSVFPYKTHYWMIDFPFFFHLILYHEQLPKSVIASFFFCFLLFPLFP